MAGKASSESMEDSTAEPEQEPNSPTNGDTEVILRTPHSVTIKKTARGFGFNLRGQVSEGGQLRSIGGELYGPMQHISYVLEGGPADQAGVKDGDRILEVNGESAEGATHVKVVQMIQENADCVSMVLISVSKEEANKLDAEFIHPPTQDLSERKQVHITIPEWRKIYSDGDNYMVYNIYLSGRFLISKRYSEFVTLNSLLKSAFVHFKLPKLPKKWPLSLNESQLEERRGGLEHYLSCICAAPSIFQSREIKSFLGIEGSDASIQKSLPGKTDVVLKILLPDKQYVNVKIERAWTAVRVIAAVSEKLNLSAAAQRYFAIFEMMEHDFMRKLHESEFPHQLNICSYNTTGETCLTFRKWIFSLNREILLDRDEKIFNLIYSQAREDVSKGRVRPEVDIKTLQGLDSKGKKSDYLNLVRITEDYSNVVFPSAVTDARKEGQIILSVGLKNLSLIACDSNGFAEKERDVIVVEWDKIGEYYTDPEDSSFRFQILRTEKSPKWVQLNSKYYIYMEECFVRVQEEIQQSKAVEGNKAIKDITEDLREKADATLAKNITSKPVPSPNGTIEIQNTKTAREENDDEGL